MNLAILGYGTVGSGAYAVAKAAQDLRVTRILSRHELRDVDALVTDDIQDILNDPEVDVVAECMGGLHPAYEYVVSAMTCGKHVVTPNKTLVSAYWQELHAAARQNGVAFRYTPSAGGGIPWLFNLQRQMRCDTILAVSGIVNGTCNYILDSMHRTTVDFADILAKAQALGYAEKDPTADIGGYDAQRKCAISASLAFETFVPEEAVLTFGIQAITAGDVAWCQDHGYTCRLLMHAGRQGDSLYAYVEPTLLPPGALEASVSANNNLISLTGEHIGRLSFYGQGAGQLPTGSSVIQDVLDIRDGVGSSIPMGTSDCSVNNGSVAHPYYVREHGEGRITEAMTVAAAHAMAAASDDAAFFMAGIPEASEA